MTIEKVCLALLTECMCNDKIDGAGVNSLVIKRI